MACAAMGTCGFADLVRNGKLLNGTKPATIVACTVLRHIKEGVGPEVAERIRHRETLQCADGRKREFD